MDGYKKVIEMTYWKLVARNDVRGRLLADSHYSRKKIGAVEFCPPGHNIVLLGMNNDALWVSHRPSPTANLAKPRFDGFDCYDNPYFRNESNERASDLIIQALAITRCLWQDYQPKDGFHSFVDTRKVKPVMRRGKPVYGWVFEKAGFYLYEHVTQTQKLLRYIMNLDTFMNIEPIEPNHEQTSFNFLIS